MLPDICEVHILTGCTRGGNKREDSLNQRERREYGLRMSLSKTRDSANDGVWVEEVIDRFGYCFYILENCLKSRCEDG